MLIREIRAEEKEKIDQIIRLEEVVFGKNGGVDEWILKPYVRYGKVYIALEDEEVIGVAELMRNWDGKTVYIYGFAIKQSKQGKGIGKAFLRKVISEVKKENAEKLTLTVDEKNKQAISLYENMGFEKIEILKDEYGKGIDRLYMEYTI